MCHKELSYLVGGGGVSLVSYRGCAVHLFPDYTAQPARNYHSIPARIIHCQSGLFHKRTKFLDFEFSVHS